MLFQFFVSCFPITEPRILWKTKLFRGVLMIRKHFSEEDILNILRQVEMDLAGGKTVESAIWTAGVSDATYYKWRKMYGGVGKAKLHEFKEMEIENARLRRIVANLELEKLILEESRDYSKLKAWRSPICVRPLFMSVRNWPRLSGKPAKWSAQNAVRNA